MLVRAPPGDKGRKGRISFTDGRSSRLLRRSAVRSIIEALVDRNNVDNVFKGDRYEADVVLVTTPVSFRSCWCRASSCADLTGTPALRRHAEP